MRLDRAVDLFLEGYFSTCERSEKTVRAYATDLRQFLAGRPQTVRLDAVSPEDIEAWALTLKKKGLAPTTLRRKFAVLRIFFNYWTRKAVLDRSPLWLLRLNFGKAKQLLRTVSARDMRRILEQVRRRLPPQADSRRSTGVATFLHARNRALVEVLFATGIRVGEAAALRTSDLDLDARSALIRGKGSRERLAFLADEPSFTSVRAYLSLRAARNPPNERLFLSRTGAPLSPQGISLALQRVARSAGVDTHVTPHMLRHTAATYLLRNGADLRVVQEFLGHASITTTQRYTHLTKDDLIQTLKACHPGRFLQP